MRVYKYFNSRYKTAIALELYYINTFENIRSQYEAGAISDPTEGVVRNFSGDLLIGDSNHPSAQAAVQDLRMSGIDIQGAATNIGIRNVTFETRVKNAYIFCVTTKRNDFYWQNLPSDQGGPYDCCLEISHFNEFSRRLEMALKDQTIFIGQSIISGCFFEDNNGIISDGSTKRLSYFRKPGAQDYRKQKEARAVFIPHQALELRPRTVYIKSADLVKAIRF